MILITGGAQIKPDCRDAALALGIEHSARSRAEPGCLAHNCHIDAEDPLRIIFVEKWADMTAVMTHFAVPESGEFVRQLAGMAVDAPQIRLFEAQEMPNPLRTN